MRRTIIYKVTNGCNLGCTYCYERRRLGFLKSNGNDGMAALLPHLEREAYEHEGNRYMICLHGGEPLLMGISAFQSIASCLERLNKNTNNSFAFSLQTNATLLTDEWAQVLRHYASLMGERGIGVSLDGDEDTHNSFRGTISGRSSYSTVMNGIRCLHDYGVPFGILSVTTQVSMKRDASVFSRIMEISPKFWRLLPCYNLTAEGNLMPYSVKPSEYANYLKKQFLRWIRSNLMKKVIVDPFATLISVIKNQPVPWCEYREDKCENFLSVETDGSLCVCDTFSEMIRKDESRLDGCNFHDALMKMPSYYDHIKESLDIDCHRNDCPARRICHGGCYGMRWLFIKKNPELYRDYCQAKQCIISFIQQAIKVAESS